MNKSYTLGLYEKSMPHNLSLTEKLAHTKEYGFDFLEVSIDETDEKLSRLNWSKDERKDVINAINELSVPIGSMCLSGHRKYPLGSLNESIRQQSLDIMEKAINLACCWGIRVIQLAGYDVYYEEGNEKTADFFLENLAKSTDMAAKYGVTLAFETMETPFMDTVAKAMFYVEKISSPWLQVYPDLGNLTNAAKIYGHEVSEDLSSGRGHIAALHLKETVPGKYRDVPFGTGHVNFKEGLETVKSLGVNRFVAEFWDNGSYRSQIEHAHQFLSKFL